MDDDRDRCFFVRMTLLRRFPDAVVEECQTLASTLAAVRAFRSEAALGVVIVHRAGDADGWSVVEVLRREDAAVPLILVSSRPRSLILPGAGPARSISYEDWPTIGLLAEEILVGADKAAP